MAKLSKERALAAIKVAGASNDQTAFLRIYSENRIGFEAAKAEFAKGLAIGSRAGAWS